MKKRFALSYLTPLVLVLGLISSRLLAQNTSLTTIHGRVTDSISGAPLPYASVQVEGEELGTRTDIDGFFFFQTKQTILKTHPLNQM